MKTTLPGNWFKSRAVAVKISKWFDPAGSRRGRTLCWFFQTSLIAAFATATVSLTAEVSFTSLYNFKTGPQAWPVGSLVRGSDGSLYGTASSGGPYTSGTVFKITPDGSMTILHSFTGSDGSAPRTPMVLASDGFFYGFASGGVPPNPPTIFKISADGAFTNIYTFTNNFYGEAPVGELLQGNDGYLYGVTSHGGSNGLGTLFKLSTNGVLTSLYSFTGGADGGNPQGGLCQGSDGYFYGTTTRSSNIFCTVFKFDGSGTLTTISSFDRGAGTLESKLVQGNDGNFYGSRVSSGWGTSAFKMTPDGTLTDLYPFPKEDGANAFSISGLSKGSDGYFYGTTAAGLTYPSGTVFKMDTNGTATILHVFVVPGEGEYASSLVQGADGSFYGTTVVGGTNNTGTVFKAAPDGTFTSLYSFPQLFPLGDSPGNGVIQGSDGNFYGTTKDGGSFNLGTIFKLDTNGVLTSLHSFTGGFGGAYGTSGLVQGNDGSFYGSTPFGGTNGGGTLYKITPNGTFTTLCSFPSGGNSGNSSSTLVQAGDGNFYGTVADEIFKITSAGAFTLLYTFTNGADGSIPYGGFVEGADGNLYGTTFTGGTNEGHGTVFKITPQGALSVLNTFNGTNGGNPTAGLCLGKDGYFYGTTSYGGTNLQQGGFGTIFRINSTGDLTTLYCFTGGGDGSNPQTPLTQATDGFFYGVVTGGGSNGWGAIFKTGADGSFSNVYTFTNGADGGFPHTPLIQATDGSFYGTMSNNLVFRLSAGIPGPPPSILLPTDAAFGFTNSTTSTRSTFAFDISAPAGTSVIIQSSPDLQTWTSIQTNSITTSPLYFTDPQPASVQKFYRAILH